MTWFWLTWLIGSGVMLLGISAVAVFFGTKWTELSRTMFWLTAAVAIVAWPILITFGWLIEFLVSDSRDSGRWL